jgi:hypothetical protein
MVAEGLAGQIAIGTDLAGTAFWQETGPTSLPGQIVTRLQGLGFDAPTVQGLTGGNIADRLAGSASL